MLLLPQERKRLERDRLRDKVRIETSLRFIKEEKVKLKKERMQITAEKSQLSK